MSGGKTFQISKVKPVASGSASVDVPAAIVKGSAQMNAAKREKMEPFKARLRAFVQGGGKTVNQVGQHMKAELGFEQALSDARLNKPGGIKQFAQLFPEFKVSGGMGQSTVTLA